MRRKSFFKEVENLVLNFIPVTKTPALISVHSFQTACVFTASDAVANADLTECCQYTHVRKLLMHYWKQCWAVFLSLLPQNRGLLRGWRWGGVEGSVHEMLFLDNSRFNVSDLDGCVPPAPLQRVTLSHKASRRWQWHACAQAELWVDCLMWRDTMAQAGL